MNGFRGSNLAVALVTLALSATITAAQSDRHAHAADAGAARLGTVAFPTSAKASAQAPFLRGIALLHSFHYEEAAKAFQAAEHADAAFALPYWFEAFTHSHILWGEDDPAAARGVLARLGATAGDRLGRAATPRERAYGAAIESFYADATPEIRARAFADSMRSVATRYPDDLEAAAFSSLSSMIALHLDAFPPEDKRARSADMIDRAEHVFATSPNHPGAAHYLIHVSDLDPSFTTRALPAARAYALIAPDASHALHMPSHVFVRLGMWDDVAASNVRSWNASRREMVRDHATGADLDSHSLLFLAYAYLESGRWRAAHALVESARRVIGKADVSGALHVDGRYAVSDLAFLYALETDRWPDAVLPPAADGPAKNPRAMSFALTSDYSRIVIQAKRGDTAALVRGVALFRARADSAGFATRMKNFIATELEGMLAQARRDPSRAIERFARAGLAEDGAPVVGPPHFVVARELLGAAYLQAGQADSAAAQFERVLVNTPNRSAALLGLARSRLAAGDSNAAAAAYARVNANWRHADTDLPALAEVRAGASRRFVRAEARSGDTLANEIRFALLPLPEQFRPAATVMRMDSSLRSPVVLRQGSNGMVCMRFVHGEDAWDARCYDASMARLILRVRELFASAVTRDSIGPRLKADIGAGTLTLPANPTAGYRVLGPVGAYNSATGVATARLDRWQSLHIPFATAQAMGLPDESTISTADRGHVPYVMASGTWWSHVMIEHR
jgi:tetratricopeptide (TPR) repeat protein